MKTLVRRSAEIPADLADLLESIDSLAARCRELAAGRGYQLTHDRKLGNRIGYGLDVAVGGLRRSIAELERE